jgi:hypothetical protein
MVMKTREVATEDYLLLGLKFREVPLVTQWAAMEGARMTTPSGQSGQTTAQAAKYVE